MASTNNQRQELGKNIIAETTVNEEGVKVTLTLTIDLLAPRFPSKTKPSRGRKRTAMLATTRGDKELWWVGEDGVNRPTGIIVNVNAMDKRQDGDELPELEVEA